MKFERLLINLPCDVIKHEEGWENSSSVKMRLCKHGKSALLHL